MGLQLSAQGNERTVQAEGWSLDWYRNSEWSEDIADAFEMSLKRSRKKAQYLTIQSYQLLATRPDVAENLARRAIAYGDDAIIVQASNYLGTALAVQGKTDEAIAAYEQAIEVQAANPRVGSQAHLDQALLIALNDRRDMFDTVLIRLTDEAQFRPDEQHPAALIALAIIQGALDPDANAAAEEALRWLGEQLEGCADLPPLPGLERLVDRLRLLRWPASSAPS